MCSMELTKHLTALQTYEPDGLLCVYVTVGSYICVGYTCLVADGF